MPKDHNYCNLNKAKFPYKFFFVTKRTPHPWIYRTHPPWGPFIVQLSANFYMSQFCNWQRYLFSKVIKAAPHSVWENRTMASKSSEIFQNWICPLSHKSSLPSYSISWTRTCNNMETSKTYFFFNSQGKNRNLSSYPLIATRYCHLFF